MVFYIFGIIGIENFNTETFDHDESSPYEPEQNYADFTSFMGAQLILFQVMIEAEWSNYTYDYAYKFNDLWSSAIYFDVFHMIVQLILLSLIKGIVWEVFTVVETT